MLLIYCGVSVAGSGEALEQARAFAERSPPCGLDHGYLCRDAEESDFIGLKQDGKMVSGNYLAAFQIAVAAFSAIEDLTAEEKSLHHYKIGFSENDTQYIVHFQALLLPSIVEGQPQGIMRGTYGRTTRYWINKQSMAVEKRLFYK